MRLWLYGILALAILGAIGGIYYAGYHAGETSKEAEWEEANRQADAAERQSRLARETEARASAAAIATAERRARDADARWRAAQAESGPIATASCPKTDRPVVQPTADAHAADTAGSGIRFTAAGLGLWDSAWTGPEGQPFFGDPGDIASGAIAATAPFPTLEGAFDNHAENAQRCSENARQLGSLIALLRRLQATK